jgi:hypothetical protein
MAALVWSVIGGVIAVLLLVSWLMDRSAKRRGRRTLASSDIAAAVRDGRRDAEVVNDAGALLPRDVSWTSWSRRNR